MMSTSSTGILDGFEFGHGSFGEVVVVGSFSLVVLHGQDVGGQEPEQGCWVQEDDDVSALFDLLVDPA